MKIDDVLIQVINFTGEKREDILSKNRTPEYVAARHLLMWYLVEVIGMSAYKISLKTEFDRATVYHAVKKYGMKYHFQNLCDEFKTSLS